MEAVDPLKVPAYMRKKVAPKQVSSTYLKPTPVPKKAKPKKLRLKKTFNVAPKFPADPAPLRAKRRGSKLILVGVTTQYLDKINVAIIKLGMDIEVGDKLQLVGSNEIFKHKIHSMQYNRKNVEKAGRDMEIGIKVSQKAVVGELVYVFG
ncbi:hypothetical protein KAR91_21900 [Candidatus Pacearchaeota archaeon]|nr:hypothetical protein [Candidatus Pacearchaeota archaeon]